MLYAALTLLLPQPPLDLERITRTYPHAVWLNPVSKKHWDYSESTTIIRRIFSERIYPITIEGLESAMKELVR